MVGIRLETEEQIVQIFNVYNDCKHSRAIWVLDFFLCSHEGRQERDRDVVDILVGGFDKHHPMWDSPENTHLFTRGNLDAAEKLIEMTVQHKLSIVLQPHVPILRTVHYNVSITTPSHSSTSSHLVILSFLIPSSLWPSSSSNAFHSTSLKFLVATSMIFAIVHKSLQLGSGWP